jgi:GNAT superfamily N-acetyltransferase
LKPERRVVVEEIEKADSAWVATALRLSERVFPPGQRVSREDLVDRFEEKRLGLLRPSNFHFLVARHGDELHGFVQGSYVAQLNVCFVSYLAVEPKFRGGRVGPLLRQHLILRCRRDARLNRCSGIRAVVGEVDGKSSWLRTLVRSRNAIALDVHFEQPAFTPGGSPVPLVLYVQRLDRSAPSLPVARVRRLVYGIYRQVYRIRFPLRDPSFRRFLASLESRQRIGQKRLPPASRRPGGGME